MFLIKILCNNTVLRKVVRPKLKYNNTKISTMVMHLIFYFYCPTEEGDKVF